MRRNNFVTRGVLYFLLLGFLTYLLISQDSRNTVTDPGDVIEELGNEASMNWTTKAVRVKGNGFGPEDVKELGRRKILAKRAAEMDAYRNLVEVVKGIQVTSYASVEDMMLESDTIKTQTEEMLKGMKVVAVNYSNEGSCEVTAEVKIDKNGNFLLLAALNKSEVKVTDNYPKFDWVTQKKELSALDEKEEKMKDANQKRVPMQNQLKGANNNKPAIEEESEYPEIKVGVEPNTPVQPGKKFDPKIYTGLLVDARGFSLKPVLAPSILNENTIKVYGIGGKTPTNPFGGEIAKYTCGDIEWTKKNRREEIGNNPLIVKCIKVKDRSDVMISNEDAQKVFEIREVLEQQKVAILI
jgi:hypothetical protein